jgi:hypothetical protein
VAGAVGVGFWACRNNGPKAATKKALAYVPQDAVVVVGFNSDAVGDPFASAFVNRIEADPAYRAWRRECDVDPIKAFDRMTIAVRDMDGESGVFVIQGKQLDKLVACTAKQESSIKRDGDVLMFREDGDTLAMVLANDDTLVGVFGDGTTAAEAREVVNGVPSLADDASFKSLLDKVDTGDAFWFAARGKPLAELDDDFDLVSIGGSIELGERIGVDVIVRFADESDAKQAEDGARLLLPRKLEGIDIGRDGADLTLEAKVSRGDTKKLLRELGTEW